MKMPGFLRPLTDFGVGKKSVWEGGVGLFVLMGAALAGGLAAWVSGASFNKGRGYQCTVQFPEACSITVGTPVRLRGIQVGSVLNVQPHLDRVDVLLEVADENTVIPRNSRIYANQSGLIAEPLVDIMPQLPIPDYEASPLSPLCDEEGNVVCNNGLIKGEKGVALDDLVYVCTRLMRQMDVEGMDTIVAAAETVSSALRDAQPLVDATTKLLDQVHPLLAQLRETGVIENIDALSSLAVETARDIQTLQQSVLDADNINALRQSVKTLTKTLQHIENIAGDMGVMTSDDSVRSSLRQLVEAFSRLVDD